MIRNLILAALLLLTNISNCQNIDYIYAINYLNSVNLTDKANRNNGGCGIKSDFVPWFYDVLLSKDLNQKELLQGYSESKKARALFPYIHLERSGLSQRTISGDH